MEDAAGFGGEEGREAMEADAWMPAFGVGELALEEYGGFERPEPGEVGTGE